MPTTKHRINSRQKKMVCNCGSKKITRFVGGGKKASPKNTQAAKKLASMTGAKKVAPKKVAAKKQKGNPCKCTNPFAKK